MDFDDHSTTSEDSEPRVYKLLSETDIQVVHVRELSIHLTL